jgi:His/Glu/Gln/Arg/opine family amino acid ABC transporter permease subunit
MFEDFFIIALEYLPRLLKGALETLRITAMGVSLGFVVGLIIGFCRAYRVPGISQLGRFYVILIRGTPLLVQIFFIFFGLPSLTGNPIPPLVAGVAAVTINSGAYFSEIIRGAVQSVHKSQVEAGRSLGLGWFKTMRFIVWPQAFITALPSLGNQFIISLKDTSLMAVISVEELTRNGQIIIAATFRAFQIWLLVALIYLLLTGVMTIILNKLEDYLSQYMYA